MQKKIDPKSQNSNFSHSKDTPKSHQQKNRSILQAAILVLVSFILLSVTIVFNI